MLRTTILALATAAVLAGPAWAQAPAAARNPLLGEWWIRGPGGEGHVRFTPTEMRVWFIRDGKREDEPAEQVTYVVVEDMVIVRPKVRKGPADGSFYVIENGRLREPEPSEDGEWSYLDRVKPPAPRR